MIFLKILNKHLNMTKVIFLTIFFLKKKISKTNWAKHGPTTPKYFKK